VTNNRQVARGASIVAIALGVVLLIIAVSDYFKDQSPASAMISGALAIAVGALCYQTTRQKQP
jgi:uncharacterized membrane protein YgaE (UPF0421/DUF939 family)